MPRIMPPAGIIAPEPAPPPGGAVLMAHMLKLNVHAGLALQSKMPGPRFTAMQSMFGTWHCVETSGPQSHCSPIITSTVLLPQLGGGASITGSIIMAGCEGEPSAQPSTLRQANVVQNFVIERILLLQSYRTAFASAISVRVLEESSPRNLVLWDGLMSDDVWVSGKRH